MKGWHKHLMEELDPLNRLFFGRLREYERISGDHSLRVARIAGYVGVELGYFGQELRLLRSAALQHDHGKIVIPLELLKKEGELLQEEQRAVALHTKRGYELLVDSFGESIAAVARDHHAAFLEPGDFSDMTRIVAVADQWDALRSTRPYRKGLGAQETYQIIQKRVTTDSLAMCSLDIILSGEPELGAQGFLWRHAA